MIKEKIAVLSTSQCRKDTYGFGKITNGVTRICVNNEQGLLQADVNVYCQKNQPTLISHCIQAACR